MLSAFLFFAGLLPWLLLLASRQWWLAPYRAGWLLYLSNVFWELIHKRTRLGRTRAEALVAVCSLALMGLASASLSLALAMGLVLLVAELISRNEERRLLTQHNAKLDESGLRGSGPQVFPGPSTHPDLTLNLVGPFVERWPHYQLGLLPAEHGLVLELLVGNHSLVPCQHPVQVALALPAGWACTEPLQQTLQPVQPETVQVLRWHITPAACSAGSLTFSVVWDGQCRNLAVRHAGARQPRAGEIREAVITRYPGARRAAFAWRGDMDLYDRSSFQSLRGLIPALELGRRYGIAQTIYLSTRLSLDQASAREWAAHYGVDRGADEIPQFVAWMRENVDFRYSCPYPAQGDRPHVVELGNHGHLHYDTDTSGAPGNGWKAGARPGEGQHPWSQGEGSLNDQRENILEATRWCLRTWGVVPRSWAKPGRGNDAFTPQAVEAAGCEVATGSDIRARDNVLRQPAPHHPAGTRIVELTARYPSDPQHGHHVAMLRFWMHRAHRLGIPMVMLVHQHMRQFEGMACSRFTEFLLRYALERFQGDLYVDTVYGIGAWWRDVISPETRRVTLSLADDRITVSNGSGRDLLKVPVDITLADGSRLTRLVDVRAGEVAVVLDVSESRSTH